MRELHVLTLEEAIRKMTSMPADQIRQTNRGRISEGSFADLVVFEEDKLMDQATYSDSKQPSKGIEQMWINGVFVIKNTVLTPATPGRWLRHSDEK